MKDNVDLKAIRVAKFLPDVVVREWVAIFQLLACKLKPHFSLDRSLDTVLCANVLPRISLVLSHHLSMHKDINLTIDERAGEHLGLQLVQCVRGIDDEKEGFIHTIRSREIRTCSKDLHVWRCHPSKDKNRYCTREALKSQRC